MDELVVKRLQNSLVGVACSEVVYQGVPTFQFGVRGLTILSAWRVSQADEIVVASSDPGVVHMGVREKLVTYLQGQEVREVIVRGPFNDLSLRLSNDTVLETFADSELYEHWNLVGGADDMIIAGPGRLWSTFGERVEW